MYPPGLTVVVLVEVVVGVSVGVGVKDDAGVPVGEWVGALVATVGVSVIV